MNDKLAPFRQHGVTDIKVAPGGEAVGVCPWCKKPKFYFHPERQVWDCKTCSLSGNLPAFFREVVQRNAAQPNLAALRLLSEDRGGLAVRTLRAWGIGTVAGAQAFTYPAYHLGTSGKPFVSDVRRYRPGGKPFSSAGGKAGLMFAEPPPDRGPIWVSEGEWDGMAYYEALREQEIADGVVAVPGAGTFPQETLAIFRGREVNLLFDNDIAGQQGLRRAWTRLQGVAKSIKRIVWPDGLPDGFDIRDLYLETGRSGAKTLERVRKLLSSDPPETLATAIAKASGPDTVNPNGRGVEAGRLRKAYQKWLHLESLDPIDVIFGSVFANRLDVDPLWIFIVGPSGGCKSELLMSLSAAPLIHCVTSITPHTLLSGMNFGGVDPSLLPKLFGKTLIVKDFTALLSLNPQARDEIFGILRDAYDGRICKTFGNQVTREYEGRFGIVAGVTGVIDAVAAQNVVLGERFIRYRLRTQGKVMAGTNAILRAMENLGKEAKFREELRAIAKETLDRPPGPQPEAPLEMKKRIGELAHWAASMRGAITRERYAGGGNVIASKPSQEIATRLAKQLLTLGTGIAIFRGEQEISEDVYRIIAAVGLDTCPDRAEELVRCLFVAGGMIDIRSLIEASHFPHETVRWCLQDLDMLHIVRRVKGKDGCYELTDAVRGILERLKIYNKERAWKQTETKHKCIRTIR